MKYYKDVVKWSKAGMHHTNKVSADIKIYVPGLIALAIASLNKKIPGPRLFSQLEVSESLFWELDGHPHDVLCPPVEGKYHLVARLMARKNRELTELYSSSTPSTLDHNDVFLVDDSIPVLVQLVVMHFPNVRKEIDVFVRAGERVLGPMPSQED